MSEEVVTGLADLQKFLDQLPPKIEANVLRGAMRAGSKVQLSKARDEVPVDQGDLRDSLRIKTSKRGGTVKATLSAGNKKAWYARLVEMGTAAHFIRPKGRKSLFFAGIAREVVSHPGSRKNPFMRRTLDSTVPGVLAAVGDYIRKRLTKAGIDVPGPENF